MIECRDTRRIRAYVDTTNRLADHVTAGHAGCERPVARRSSHAGVARSIRAPLSWAPAAQGHCPAAYGVPVSLRIGVLGAARITPAALIAPARRVDGVVVAAVAARDPDRATAFAARHGIERVLAEL